MDLEKQTIYEEEMIRCIKDMNWCRWAHINWDVLSYSRATAYNHHLDKLDAIKGAFAHNRASNTHYLLQKWIKSDNATLQIAAFKIIAEPEDHKRLNQAYIEQSNTNVDLTGLSTLEIKELLKGDE